jgi:glycosyltransferase involved in cell wall biosynthesis
MKIVYIIGTYPRLTTTFIDREICSLEKLGAQIKVISVRRPDSELSQDQIELIDRIQYLLPVSVFSLITSHLQFAFGKPQKFFGTLVYLLSRQHPSWQARFKTLLHFSEGVYAAGLLGNSEFDHLHAHFMDRAATIAMVASRLLDKPYSLTAHANDIYVNPVLLLEKLSQAKFTATCTGYNKTYLEQFGEGLFNHKLFCIYHGLPVDEYTAPANRKNEKYLMLSVGQLKEKKGFDFLLRACRILVERGHSFECQIVGEGPQRDFLESLVKELSLEELVQLCGALPHHQVIEKFQQANLFVLPAVLAADGDRDGIPNVILEAMAMDLPVVSTNHSAIPEVVEERVSGLLVPPADEHALADALEEIVVNPGYGIELGSRGRQIVIDKFDPLSNSKLLFDQFVA